MIPPILWIGFWCGGVERTYGDDPTCVPNAAYADAATCIECHPTQCRQWTASDHAHAMAHATGESVRGDFNDITLRHFGFDGILALDDAEAKRLIDMLFAAAPRGLPKYDRTAVSGEYGTPGRKYRPTLEATPADLVLALRDAKAGMREKCERAMSAAQRTEYDAEVQYREALRFARPGDIAAAQQRIVRLMERLIGDGNIKQPPGDTFRMFRDGNRYMIATERETHEIRFTLGYRPLQQYLVALPGGRLQCLPVAWDTCENRWFHLYPKERIASNDPLHWTQPLQNWNMMCADCHTTNFEKRFDDKTNRYSSTMSEIGVGCQSCHGPCGNHVATARNQGFKDRWGDLSRETPSLASATATFDSCAACHARRAILHAGPKPPTAPLTDWYVPELPDRPIYYPDGQLLEEAFEIGSFLQAKMHHKGVSCINCHEPHSLQLKFGGTNRLCTQCHDPGIFDTPKHHFHPDASQPGTVCVECHFPQSRYMVGDPRRDHSIRKPNPALSRIAGVPNACTLCHDRRDHGETLDWAAACVERWYADKRQSQIGYSATREPERHYALAIAAGRRGDRTAVPALTAILRETDAREFRPVIQAAALTLLGQCGDAKTFDTALPYLAHDNPFLRYAAVGVLATKDDTIRKEHLPPLLVDASRAVRLEAARALAPVAETLAPSFRESFDRAKTEYIAAQQANADQPAAHLNLAVLEQDLVEPKMREVERWYAATVRDQMQAGASADTPELREAKRIHRELMMQLTATARKRYEESLRLDPAFIPSRINLAMLYDRCGEPREAEKQFREALHSDPENGDVWYSLGLLYAAENDYDRTIPALRRAVELLPQNRRIRYNLGLALLATGHHADAEKELQAILALEPDNIDYLYAAFSLYRQSGDRIKAIDTINRLIRLQPEEPTWPAMKRSLATPPGR